MINRIEIKGLFQSKALRELWQTIQQELPQLHYFKEEDDLWEDARIDNLEDFISECNALLCKCNFQDVSIEYLYNYLSSDCFKCFCKQVLLENEKAEIIIDESERDYIVNELEMSEDEYKQRCKTYDILEIARYLIEYYLLNKHPEILLEYYKTQDYDQPEQIFKSQVSLYLMCEKLVTNSTTA